MYPQSVIIQAAVLLEQLQLVSGMCCGSFALEVRPLEVQGAYLPAAPWWWVIHVWTAHYSQKLENAPGIPCLEV